MVSVVYLSRARSLEIPKNERALTPSTLLSRPNTGQHNDSRMNMALITTAVQYGAVAANHTDVTSLIKNEEGKIVGARMKDNLTGRTWETKAKVSSCFKGYQS